MTARFPTLAEVVAAHPEGQEWGIPAAGVSGV